MDVEVDHYAILGLPSGVEGAKLSDKDIKKAYHSKALELHPDKRRGVSKNVAEEDFKTLKTSYEILKDEKARKLFDDLLRVKYEKIQRQSQQDSKRRRMMSDLEERERSAFAPDPSREARHEEERIARKLKEEIDRIRAMHTGKSVDTAYSFQKETTRKASASGGGESTLNEGKVLKVSWEKVGEDYSAQRLRELFEQFGEVEDVVIKTSKKKRWALVVMASKDAAVAATQTVCGDLSNPLLVLPLKPAASFPTAREPVQPDGPKLNNLVGAGYQAFEDSVLKKLQKAAERQK